MVQGRKDFSRRRTRSYGGGARVFFLAFPHSLSLCVFLSLSLESEEEEKETDEAAMTEGTRNLVWGGARFGSDFFRSLPALPVHTDVCLVGVSS